jgi:hypothetical protein
MGAYNWINIPKRVMNGVKLELEPTANNIRIQQARFGGHWVAYKYKYCLPFKMSSLSGVAFK